MQVKRALQLGADRLQGLIFESDEQMHLVVWAGKRFPEEDLRSLQFLLQGWVGLFEGKWDTRQKAG